MDPSTNRGRVLFPGALNSEFTDKLDFIQPSKQDAIPTYRVMNQYGDIIDKDIGVDIEDEEALQIYKNMVKRQSIQREASGQATDNVK
jgi:2-oxoisovalerate dehydrogenase E1 component alpha subunit